MTKHFFKTVIIFTFMIALGLVGIYLVSYFDEEGIDTGIIQTDKR